MSASRPIGKIATPSSTLGLGCWSWSDAHWTGETDVAGVITAALEQGITHFDLAQAYGRGAAEQMVARYLAHRCEGLFLATKATARPREAMMRAIERSLQRMKVDVIDLFYIHWPQAGVDLAEPLQALAQAKEEGKIRGIGTSNLSLEELGYACQWAPIDAHQLHYTLTWRSPELDLLPFCHQKKITVVTYGVLAMGALTGKYPSWEALQGALDRQDVRRCVPYFQRENWRQIEAVAIDLKILAKKYDLSLPTLIASWILRREEVGVVLMGARSIAQVKANFSQSPVELPAECVQALKEIEFFLGDSAESNSNIFGYEPTNR